MARLNGTGNAEHTVASPNPGYPGPRKHAAKRAVQHLEPYERVVGNGEGTGAVTQRPGSNPRRLGNLAGSLEPLSFKVGHRRVLPDRPNLLGSLTIAPKWDNGSMKTRYLIPMSTFLGGIALVGYRLVVRGALILDLDLGRKRRPLGPIEAQIAASPETVFDVIAEPYLGKTSKAMESKLHVLERGSDMVLAEHFTDVGHGHRATTLETVLFERPNSVHFRLVRGPVPEVIETFELASAGDGTLFTYTGVLGTDFWGLGQRWGKVVANKWEQAVRESLDGIKAESERRVKHPKS
jgi:hypothetical protein